MGTGISAFTSRVLIAAIIVAPINVECTFVGHISSAIVKDENVEKTRDETYKTLVTFYLPSEDVQMVSSQMEQFVRNFPRNELNILPFSNVTQLTAHAAPSRADRLFREEGTGIMLILDGTILRRRGARRRPPKIGRNGNTVPSREDPVVP